MFHIKATSNQPDLLTSKLPDPSPLVDVTEV